MNFPLLIISLSCLTISAQLLDSYGYNVDTAHISTCRDGFMLRVNESSIQNEYLLCATATPSLFNASCFAGYSVNAAFVSQASAGSAVSSPASPCVATNQTINAYSGPPVNCRPNFVFSNDLLKCVFRGDGVPTRTPSSSATVSPSS